ncbi:FadR/GntR family transcriptional regulator [Latilactobacillus fuchuensis]|uniref:FadR/GntR family transcriptional regulator n=1 Tax=Latilactobacillus fuchuensis TaxID=164393 RepID=UPI0039B10F13
MVKSQTLVSQTTEAIIDYIKEHNIQPGEKLPNEYELSNLLDIGRSTFREAIRILVSRNILEVRQGSGTYLSAKRGQSTDPFGMAMIKDKRKMIFDLYDMRYILEPEVAMLAAEHATQTQIDRLEELVNEIEASFKSGNKDHVELDIQFHSLIGEASGNSAYSYILPIINESIALFNSSYNDFEAKLFTKSIHRQIIHSIATRNQREAYDTMLIHMANNRLALRNLIEREHATLK